MTTATQRETRGFQAEVKQLLRLMIHSLYSNREIFLRELISNASDACDKLRFRALAEPAWLPAGEQLAIDVDFDPTARTVTIADNGIGLSREEAVEHLGTIAKSGTAEFLSQLTGDQQKDAQLIGQFGVGFYSSFIVADRVEVYSRKAGLDAAHGVRWESDGSGQFTVESVELPSRGTRIVLHLKEDAKEFADAWRLRGLVRRYSDHIAFPVRMPTEGKATAERETVNNAQALWTRAKSTLSDEDYVEFYKHVSHDFGAPLAWSHNRVEGKREYTTLLYVPGRAPFDLWNREAPRGLKLYVKRVFILDDAEQFLPLYLRFVKGVVDSSDLPLNVSRELLQEDPEIEAMRSGIARRVLDLLTKLAKDEPEKYASFWKEFGQVLKEGVAEDATNRERIARLLRFATTHADREAQDQSLEHYVARMRPGQKHVYYVVADTWNSARQSPHLERLRQKGVEALLLHDRVDEWMMSYLGEFEGRSFRDVSRGDLDLGDLVSPEEKAAETQNDEAAAALCGRLREALSGRVESVRVTQRLAESPACLVRSENDYGLQMRKLLEAAGQALPSARPTLEINPAHPLVKKLEQLPDGEQFRDLAGLLHDEATLAEGGQLADPAGFVRRLNRLLLAGA
ncbi:MAG: molecular chaperone HtpG [Steroidobacteraceae bacterium]|jgi:molecular chaperone HtpG|nr:molecular chaperone HtpG [Steroidobacteraceae bacterium]